MQKSDPITSGVVIPKLYGDRQTDSNRWQHGSITRNAPFATSDTPESRVRLIGSRLVALEDGSHSRSNSRAHSAHRLTPLVTPRDARFDSTYQDQFKSVSLNPRSIVPSIPSAPPLPPSPDRLRDAVGEQTGIKTHLVGTQLESLAFPQRSTAAPVLEPWEEATLRRNIQEDLGRYRDSRLRLKDIYVELAGTDRRLTGFVSFNDLGRAFNRCNVPLSVQAIRELCCAFMSDTDSTLVNYEKALSFVSSCLHMVDNQTVSPNYLQPSSLESESLSTLNGSDGRGGVLNPITGEVDYRRNYNEPLMRLVGDQIARASHDVDYDKVWQTFASADRSRNNSFSFGQMKTLADSCRFPLSDTVLEQLIDRCHKGNGLYGWQQFVEIMGRFLPQKTGLDTSSNIARRDSALNGRQQQQQQQLQQAVNVPLSLDDRQREIERLEHVVQDTHSRLAQMSAVSGANRNRWTESFEDLRRALYRSDVTQTGRITTLEAKWLTKEYNGAFGLGFTEDFINQAVVQCAAGSHSVPVEQYLHMLSANR